MTKYIKMTKKFEKVEAGYRMFTGVILNQNQCDMINKESESINYYIENFGEVEEVRLNQRHRIVNDIAMGAR